jgi:hypothetical protein
LSKEPSANARAVVIIIGKHRLSDEIDLKGFCAMGLWAGGADVTGSTVGVREEDGIAGRDLGNGATDFHNIARAYDLL